MKNRIQLFNLRMEMYMQAIGMCAMPHFSFSGGFSVLQSMRPFP